MVPYFTAALKIYSNLGLFRVAELISQNVFGGIPFYGEELHLCDEMRCVILKSKVLGLHVKLAEDPDTKETFYLTVFSHYRPQPNKDERSPQPTNITSLFEYLLRSIDGLQIDDSWKEYATQ